MGGGDCNPSACCCVCLSPHPHPLFMPPKSSWSAAASVSCQARHTLPASGTLRARSSRWLRCPRALQPRLRSQGTGNRAPRAAAPGAGLQAPSHGPPGSAAAASSLVADPAAARHRGPKRRCLPWRPRACFPEVPCLPLRRHPHLMGYFINPSISPAVQLPRCLIILHSLMINIFPLQGCGWFKV